MSFISYAQNFEDVMIWRALQHVTNGFYIDVGANDPTLYSVTRAFYDKGWHGINLEPVAEFFQKLSAQRPRDTNLQIGAGEVAGSFPFFDIPDTGLATSDPAIAQKHRAGGWTVNTLEIPVLPLSEICSQHVHGDIHFLKIDVEGAEKSVLLGMDFKKWRPWLMIVEATVPMSQETVHQSWEHLLVDADYDFVYFDGLNRYYVAKEHPELKPAFATPPNVFDGFVLNADQESKIRVIEAEASAHRARQQALAAEHQAEQALAHSVWTTEATRIAEAAVNTAEDATRLAQQATHLAQQATHSAEAQRRQTADELAAVYASTSWRMTQPLRQIKHIISLTKRRLLKALAYRVHPRAFIKRVLQRGLHWVASKPTLLRAGRRLLARFPALERQVMRLARQSAPHARASVATYENVAHLPATAHRAFTDLQRAIGKQDLTP